MASFAQLGLPPPFAKAIESLGFVTMTPVQEQALPPLLAGKDVLAQARTGSGKTVAFGLALLARVDLARTATQALVLCPTRELAEQVTTEIRRLGRFLANLRVVTLSGGVPVRTQKPSLEQAPHVIVGTPGRLLDHLQRGHVTLGALAVLVLDEADRMLDMGFFDAIVDVVAATPATRQTLLFSATYPEPIRKLSRTLQRSPVDVTVDAGELAPELEQRFYAVELDAKPAALDALLRALAPPAALVFCVTRNDVRDVAEDLARRGHAVLALHGELEQRERDEVLVRFAQRSCTVLVATDVAARGLHSQGLPLVIAYELPVGPDVHVHRIGRTGRAGEPGVALALVAPRERERARAIEGRAAEKLTWAPLPEAGDAPPLTAPMATLVIDGGRQDKLRPGDLLGALTGDAGVPGDAVGKIDVLPARAYVAVARAQAEKALAGLRKHKIKGKSFRVTLRK
jgi:ATP-independent RNA helicase DbpA